MGKKVEKEKNEIVEEFFRRNDPKNIKSMGDMYVAWKDFFAPAFQQLLDAELEIDEKWKSKYTGAIQSWIDNWEVLSVFFKFSEEIRRIMYTTNAIESLNSTYKRINRNRNVFPTDMSLLKVLYLSTLKAEKKWSMRAKKWDLCLSQSKIAYPERIYLNIW